MLLSDRRRGFGMRDENEEPDARQGALFAPDSLAPARPARPPGPTPDPFAPREPSRETESADVVAPSESTDHAAAPDDANAAADPIVSPHDLAGPGDLARPDDTTGVPGPTAGSHDVAGPSGFVTTPDQPAAPADVDAPTGFVPAPDESDAPTALTHSADTAPRRRAAALAGPTLDDVVTRVWEGMRAQVPTPCPVCRTEVEPGMGGRCGSCGSALD